MRVQLKPGLRRTWRTPESVQIGVGPGHGTVLAGLTEADAAALDRFAEGVDLPSTGGSAATARQRRLAELLNEADLLVPARSGRATFSRLGTGRHRLAADAAVWGLVHRTAGDGWGLLAARAGRHVVVTGAGRTGTALAGTLAGAGIGRVTVRDPAPVTEVDLMPGGHRQCDVGRRRDESAADLIGRAGAAAGAGPGRPDLVVLVRYAVADAGQAEPLVRADLPHLSIVLRGPDAVVGPLVVPGLGPCLRCLDLHRGDRDPAWPKVLAQLLYPAGQPAEPEEAATATLVAGLAALQVLTWLDGVARPASLGATLEVELPDGLVAGRPWASHPGCGCHWPPPDRAPDRGPDRGPDRTPVSEGREPADGTTMDR